MAHIDHCSDDWTRQRMRPDRYREEAGGDDTGLVLGFLIMAAVVATPIALIVYLATHG